MRVWYFIAYAYRCFLNMHGHEPSVARIVLISSCTFIYTHFVWRKRAVGVLAKLSSCTAASTHWRLNDCTIFIKHLMSELAHIFTKQTVLLLKVVTSM